jgi:hypothetical protein
MVLLVMLLLLLLMYGYPKLVMCIRACTRDFFLLALTGFKSFFSTRGAIYPDPRPHSN